MTTKHSILLLIGATLLAGCADEPPPPSVAEFVENPILLEAAMVRCSQNRSATRYDPECINAREAVKRIEAREDAARRAELEKQSEAKRRALRRTQQAAAEARRRAEQRERERREAEYLAQFGQLPPESTSGGADDAAMANLPGAIIAESETDSAGDEPVYNEPVYQSETLPPTDGGNAPIAEAEGEAPPPSDLGSIRDELRRRNEEGGGQNP